MSEENGIRLSWVFVAVAVVSGAALLYDIAPAGASDDHDEARELRDSGEVMPLSGLLARPELDGLRVLEADLERKRGRMVYELELLDAAGRVDKRYYDAISGEPLGNRVED